MAPYRYQRGALVYRRPAPWRIKKSKYDPDFPWLVSRLNDEDRYVPVTRCASFAAACRLTQALVWLAGNADVTTTTVSKGYPYVG